MSGVAGHTVLAFFIALALSLILMPIAVTVGAHLKMVVQPRLFRNSRNRRKISYLGGPALCLATVAGALVAGGLERSATAVIGGGLALLVIGYRDNKRRSRRWHPALVGSLQASVASVVWWLEFRQALPGPTGWFLTVFLLVGAANALNLLDNMNGVAGYTAAATAGGLTFLAFMGGNPTIALPVAALCGASIGFLPYNHKRAKVYLGAGAPEFAGFVLGASALNVSLYFGPRWAPLATLAALAVPATDSALAILGRVGTGRPVFAGGIDHISHRLFRMGFSTRKAARLHGLAALAATGSVAVALYTGPAVLWITLGVFAAIGVGLRVIEGREPVRTRRGTPILRYLGYGVIGIVALSVPPALAAAWDLRGAQQAFLEGKAHATAFNVAAARDAFARGGELSKSAESKLNWPLTLPAKLLPVIGDNLRAAQALATGGRLLAPAAELALDATAVFPAGPAGPEIGFNEGRLNTQPWPEASTDLAEAAVLARLALADPRAAGGILLPPIKGAREEFLRDGSAAVQTLEKASDAAALLPHLFADGTKRTWFLAIQNPVELRATGGFLGAFGILSAENGKLNLERFESNNELPVVRTPAPASEEFARNYDKFYARTFWSNTNMTPDFPTAASVLAGMWEQSTGRQIDGVIAIDAVGLNQLLGIVGPVSVAPVGEVTTDNFLRLALNEAYIRFPEKDNRSRFLIEVGNEVWRRLLAGNFSNPTSLMVPMGEMVATKRIQMWSPDQLDRLKRLGLAGELRPDEDADYLLVVGQNAAGNKVDYYARRRISYQVDLTNPTSVQGRVEVAIQNGAPEGAEPSYIMGPTLPKDPPGLNRTFTSIYRPGGTFVLGAQMNGAPSQVESSNELGLEVASKFLEIPPQSNGSFTIQTQRELSTPGRYKLVVQHQPNLNPDELVIDITLPKGAFVHSYSPGLELVGNHLRWTGALDREMEFEVRYGSSFRDRTNGVLAAS
jgi:UDP-N-acetylmuramyl pentapeptide phosphotransferase/UDP-N-acetylglucosamine-1-phosphate transferase